MLQLRPMRVAITGATGFIGGHLAEALADRARTICLVRPTSTLQWIASLPIETVTGDLDDRPALDRLVDGADALVHCAGVTSARSARDYLTANADGVDHLFDAIARAERPPTRVVIVSSLAAVGPSSNGPVSELSVPRPVTAYGISKLSGERRALARADGIATTVLRPPAVFGPRDPDMLVYFRLVARNMQPVLVPQQRLSLVSVATLVDAIVALLDADPAPCGVFHVTDPGVHTMGSLGDTIASGLGVRTVRVAVPAAFVRVVEPLVGIAARVSRSALLLGRDKLSDLRRPSWLMSCDRITDEIGFETRRDVDEEMIRTGSWYRAHGWL